MVNMDDSKFQIIVIIGMIVDVLEEIVGDQVEVIVLMGLGVDFYLYKVMQGDLKWLIDVDVVFYNGLYLEGKMGEVFEKLVCLKFVVVVVDQFLEVRLINFIDYVSVYDLYVWFDVSFWLEVVGIIGVEMG